MTLLGKNVNTCVGLTDERIFIISKNFMELLSFRCMYFDIYTVSVLHVTSFCSTRIMQM